MPIIKSAIKQMRASERKRQRNYTVRSRVKTSIKKVLDLIKTGKIEEAEKALRLAYKELDMAAKKNILHENNAARKKSHLAKKLSKKAGSVKA